MRHDPFHMHTISQEEPLRTQAVQAGDSRVLAPIVDQREDKGSR